VVLRAPRAADIGDGPAAKHTGPRWRGFPSDKSATYEIGVAERLEFRHVGLRGHGVSAAVAAFHVALELMVPVEATGLPLLLV
jgi:hypothetical protein